MDINSVFPSNYIKTSDLGGRNVKVVIDDVRIETVGEDERAVVYFQGKQKGLVLNKTNANTISDMFGPETEGWAGREITMYPTKTDLQGKRVDAIRIEYVDPRKQQRPAPAKQPKHDERNPPPPTQADMNDEVPF